MLKHGEYREAEPLDGGLGVSPRSFFLGWGVGTRTPGFDANHKDMKTQGLARTTSCLASVNAKDTMSTERRSLFDGGLGVSPRSFFLGWGVGTRTPDLMPTTRT